MSDAETRPTVRGTRYAPHIVIAGGQTGVDQSVLRVGTGYSPIPENRMDVSDSDAKLILRQPVSWNLIQERIGLPGARPPIGSLS